MPPLILEDIHGVLRLQSHTIEYVQLSNDWPNIHLMVTEMQHSFLSKQDLNRFIKYDHIDSPGDTPSAKKFWWDHLEELHYIYGCMVLLRDEHAI